MSYKPNKLKPATRYKIKFIALALFIYAVYGLLNNDFYLPSKRGGIHFYDDAAILAFCSFICLCLFCVTAVIDHYDERDNEKLYQRILGIFSFGFLVFLFFAAAFKIFNIS